MKKRRLIWSGLGLASILFVVGATMAATGIGISDERADCPGKVTCPLSGDQVCKDQCPLGENAGTADSEKELPACCRGK